MLSNSQTYRSTDIRAITCDDSCCCRYRKSRCTDVTVQLTTRVDNNTVTTTLKAHRVVLAAHSSWFADQILNAGPWIVADVIYLDDVCGGSVGGSPAVSPATINALVEYMYSGRESSTLAFDGR